MIWQDMSIDDKQVLINKYNDIKKSIKKLNSVKANTEKKTKYSDLQLKDYNNKVKELQKQYNEIKIQYRCSYCNSIIDLPFDKIKNLLKGKESPIFCNRKCSGSYYAYKSHEGKTEEQEQERRDKISKSLLAKEIKLSEEEKKIRSKKLNSYWEDLDKEARSTRNKKNAIKAKQTKLEKYGDGNYNNPKQIGITYRKNNNVENPAQNWNHITQEHLKIIRDKELFKQFILNIPLEDRCIYTIARKLNIGRAYCSTLINKYNLYQDPDVKIHRNLSQPQIELQEYIKSIYKGEIIINTKKIITPYELDIYIPDKQLALEFNGNYYHTTEKLDKKAHYNKSIMCEKLGIRLIHIFEYEWIDNRQRLILENIIKSALDLNKTLYARNLDIIIKESKEMKSFFNDNNIQGFRGGKFAICLIDKVTKEIYMSYLFGDAFFGKGKYQYEVIRGATKLGYNVIGGASKIWNYFIKTYNPTSCVYYIDFNYFNGNSLKNLNNMKYITTQFSFKNYFVKENKVKNRDPMHHKEIKQLEKQGLVYPIYNAGTKVYVWEK